MRTFDAFVKELRNDAVETRTAWISCPAEAIPAPGQYVSAWSVHDRIAPLASPLFPARVSPDGFLAAPPVPITWEPGSLLELSGPYGRGFNVPRTTHRLALAALGETAARLNPLVNLALQADIAVTLFSSVPVQNVPTAVEIYPTHDLPEALNWADLLLIDLPVEELGHLRATLCLQAGDHLPCPAQVLVVTIMPCSGLAECGTCYVPARRKWKRACLDGPVFDLDELAW
jgi:NAD(P)H-flavin reductase